MRDFVDGKDIMTLRLLTRHSGITELCAIATPSPSIEVVVRLRRDRDPLMSLAFLTLGLCPSSAKGVKLLGKKEGINGLTSTTSNAN